MSRYVIMKMQGGLGNQMFQYAFARHISKLTSLPIILDNRFFDDPGTATKRDFSLDVFPHEYRALSPGDSYEIIKVVEPHYHFAPGLIEELVRLSATASLYLEGFFQSWKYLVGVEAMVRDDFQICRPYPVEMLRFRERLRAETSICLHVRRTDYITRKESFDFHGFRGLEYIAAAVERITTRVKDPTFYIFSDDPQWCRENIHLDFPSLVVDPKLNGPRDSHSLHLMSSCKHFVIANSSYSWWAAWLAENPDKTVIAPLQWFNDPNVNTSDVTPPEWERI